MTTYTHTIIDGRLFMDVQAVTEPERYTMEISDGRIELKETKPMTPAFRSFLDWLDEDPRRYLEFITVKTNQTKPMNKFKRADEIIENWDKVEENFGNYTWGKPFHKGPGEYTLNQLNCDDCFRIKREPRRVWVNYYAGAEQVGVMHLSKEGAEAEATDEACESAVEFVEVIR